MLRVFAALVAAIFCALAPPAARAFDTVSVPLDGQTVDLSQAFDLFRQPDDRLQVSTAPDADGIVRRIEVRAQEAIAGSNWAVFALANNGSEQIDRLLVAPHFKLNGSGLFRPDLGSVRITAITTSENLPPERQASPEADVFLVTLDPGDIVTFVVELRTPTLPQLYLWEPDAYKDAVNAYTLFRGIVLGISGLLALFLTIGFVVRGTALFPATAALAWSVLIYLCIDFGFWNRMVGIAPGDIKVWRAVAEVLVAATLLIFTYTYLHLARWHVRYSHAMIAWLAGLLVLLGIAIIEPATAAGIARLSIGLTAGLGFLVVVFLAFRGFDRAIMLLPSWVLICVWASFAALSLVGALTSDLVQPALAAGLVLIVLLIGFTVMQHAFAGAATQGIVSDSERSALALTGAGDIVFDWDIERDSIFVGTGVEEALHLKPGTLEGPARDWLAFLHPSDRDRFRATLDAVLDQRRGRVDQDFRLRSEDGHYGWFRLRARPVIGADGDVMRLVGTLLDVTEERTSEERLLHDAVHDNLTGLPNRELFLDRLGAAMARAKAESQGRPSVFLLDLDRFRTVNEAHGMSVGDSVILAVARRLSRLVKPQDMLARFAGDTFAVLLTSETEPEKIAAFADSLRRAVRSPITLGSNEIALTASIGLSMPDESHSEAQEVVKDAEIALYHGKREGGDRIEAFRPALKAQSGTELTALEADLRRAISRQEIRVVYQPIVRLEDRTVAGFEALVRWDHPRHGHIPPTDFIPVAERTGLIVQLGTAMLDRAAQQLNEWQAALGASVPLFVTVNLSSRQILRHDLINDVKSVLARSPVHRGSLKLELTEALLMENPELSAQILTRIRELGAGLAIDDFGTGYSALSYLQRFPFDMLKIDRSFLRGSGVAREAVLKSIIVLAHNLALETVAEGVENEGDAAALHDFGCEYATGPLFGEPLLGTEARRLLFHEVAEPLALPAE